MKIAKLRFDIHQAAPLNAANIDSCKCSASREL